MAKAIEVVAKLLHIERFVKETPNCGCKKRRKDLNRFGHWIVKLLKKAAHWLRMGVK